MADSSPTGKTGDLIISGNGSDPRQAAARHCAFCGQAVVDAAGVPERFGEAFCSEAHADEFATGVRAARVQLAAAMDVAPTAKAATSTAPAAPAKSGHLKMALTMGACCIAPLLVAVVFAGGASAVYGAAAGVLPLLAGLACPLGMFFMMRAMMKHGKGDSRQGQDKEQ
jgi:hypothetical protein